MNDAQFGLLISVGLALFAALSYWVYRPWRRWKRWAKVLFVALQLLTLVATIPAAASIHRKAQGGECGSFYSCVSGAVERFLDEASD